MEVCRRSSGLLLLLGFALLATTLQDVQGEVESEGPSESECRPYIEKALKELEHGEAAPQSSETQDSTEDVPTVEITDDSSHQEGEGDVDNENYDEQGQGADSKESVEDENVTQDNVVEQKSEPKKTPDKGKEAAIEEKVTEEKDDTNKEKLEKASIEEDDSGKEKEGNSKDEADESKEGEGVEEDEGSKEEEKQEESEREHTESAEGEETKEEIDTEEEKSQEQQGSQEEIESIEQAETQEEAETQEHHESNEQAESQEQHETQEQEQKHEESESQEQDEVNEETLNVEQAESQEEQASTQEESTEKKEESKEEKEESKEEKEESKEEKEESKEEKDESVEEKEESVEEKEESIEEKTETKEEVESHEQDASKEQTDAQEQAESIEEVDTQAQLESDEKAEESADQDESVEDAASLDDLAQAEEQEESKEDQKESKEVEKEEKESEEQHSEDESRPVESVIPEDSNEDNKEGDSTETKEEAAAEQESTEDVKQVKSAEDETTESREAGKDGDSEGDGDKSDETDKIINKREIDEGEKDSNEKTKGGEDAEQTSDQQGSEEDTDKSIEEGEAVVEELSMDVEIPSQLRSREHVEQLLKLDKEHSQTESIINRVADITLKELKKLYENAIKPLEVLYKYRDLSNRHFGDAEIFSKPLILFMGPWSGGKSSIINYLTNIEYNDTALRTGAEPSPAYFNILMYGDEPEVIDGTELAADFTFSGLQKFGQGLEERLKGTKLPIKLLEKVNIVEIPGILEVRKQVSRVFPFNDACQWFIDRADIIFLVYDPSKLDVGPETEAILDQLKGREHQTRIVLNKADQVKPEELMRVQGALIWNISPLMSSPQPPIMYTTSLWSRAYEPWAPVRLLQAQERAFLRDLRSAIDKRIENKIASARRFAVRVRNHAKMVDCYLTTYYNHKSVFGNRKQVADEIIDHPQDYHIYEGLSTLTNISRYDLPDPDVYRDFFKLNPLYEFQQLSATCTYFRGCPINRLDIAIAYDLPELVGTHKKLIENSLAEVAAKESTSTPGS